MSPSNEDYSKHVDQLNQELSSTAMVGAKAPPEFVVLTDYTTFEAHYVLLEDNIVVHFYLPVELRNGVKAGEAARLSNDVVKYWQQVFPAILEPTALEHFGVPYPRLRASYTGEVQSWWLKAQGFGRVLSLDLFLAPFFERMDASLEQSLPPLGRSGS